MAPRAARHIPLAAATATLVFHLIANPHYGFFRDELYFIICGFRPAWGYVDQPPVVPLLAAGSQLFGHSLFLIRALPALFAAASVCVTCLLAVELGGGAFAEILAALVAALTPVLTSFGGKLTTDVPGLLLWPLIALFVLRIVKGADPRWWLAAGAAAGIAIESKYSVLFFAVAILTGLLVLPQRRALRIAGSRRASPSPPRSRCRTWSGRPCTATRCGRCCATPENIRTRRSRRCST